MFCLMTVSLLTYVLTVLSDSNSSHMNFTYPSLHIFPFENEPYTMEVETLFASLIWNHSKYSYNCNKTINNNGSYPCHHYNTTQIIDAINITTSDNSSISITISIPTVTTICKSSSIVDVIEVNINDTIHIIDSFCIQSLYTDIGIDEINDTQCSTESSIKYEAFSIGTFISSVHMKIAINSSETAQIIVVDDSKLIEDCNTDTNYIEVILWIIGSVIACCIGSLGCCAYCGGAGVCDMDLGCNNSDCDVDGLSKCLLCYCLYGDCDCDCIDCEETCCDKKRKKKKTDKPNKRQYDNQSLHYDSETVELEVPETDSPMIRADGYTKSVLEGEDEECSD